MVIGFRGEPELIQSRSSPLIKHKETPEIHPHLASAIFPVKSGQSTVEMWYSPHSTPNIRPSFQFKRPSIHGKRKIHLYGLYRWGYLTSHLTWRENRRTPTKKKKTTSFPTRPSSIPPNPPSNNSI